MVLGSNGDDGVASGFDMESWEVCQGSLGNCYLLCALAAAVRDFALSDELIDEEFEDVGIFGVSFWVFDRWQMAWVDANFPCYWPSRGSHSGRWRLIFASCEDPKEVWSMVVEKASQPPNVTTPPHCCHTLVRYSFQHI